MRRRAFSVAVCIAMTVLILGSCGKPKSDTNAAAPAAPTAPAATTTPAMPAVSAQLSIGTATMGGAYYPFGQAIANLVTKYSGGIQMTPEVTGGAVENCRLVIKGDVDIAITNENHAYAAVNGLEPFVNAKGDLNVVARLYPSVFHIMVPENSPINSVTDLKGKRLAVGPAGGGTLAPLEAIFKAYGMKITDIVPSYIAFNDGFTQLADGNVDAALQLSGYPAAAIMEYTATKPIKFVSVDNDKFDSILKENPYFTKVTVPASAYKTKSDGITIGIANVLFVRPDAKDDIVYAITACIFDHIDEFRAANANARDVDIKTAANASIPIHPGALKYYREKKVIQ